MARSGVEGVGGREQEQTLKTLQHDKAPHPSKEEHPTAGEHRRPGPLSPGGGPARGLRPGTAGARTWEPARLLSGGFVFSLKPLGHQVEKPLGAR